MKALILPVLLLAAGSVSAQSPSGAQLFKQRCQTCHQITPGQKSLMGPNLHGVVGRKAASVAFKFSPALQASGIEWTPETLDAYLAAPTKNVPGTRMMIALPNAGQRAAVIEYLGTLKP